MPRGRRAVGLKGDRERGEVWNKGKTTFSFTFPSFKPFSLSMGGRWATGLNVEEAAALLLKPFLSKNERF